MFGQQSTTPFASSAGSTNTNSPFGGTASNTGAFGAPASTAGSGPFGAPATGGFGGFGSPTPAAPSTGGFGGFGGNTTTATNNAQPASGFGGFGSPTPVPAPTSAFGTPATTATSSPFVSAGPAPGGLFGSAPAPATGGLFGSSAPSTSAFGAPAPSTGFGGFGSTMNTNTSTSMGGSSVFGAAPAPASGGLFGSAPAPAAGGLFGSSTPAPSAGASGTLAFPYTSTNKMDGTSTINIQAITAMTAYENKSLEELRFEDYSNGNKGSMGQQQQQPQPTVGGFGAPAPSTGFGATSTSSAFGTSPAPAFGAAPATGGLFGSTAPAPSSAFGSTTSSAFGSTPAAATPASTSAFGSATTSAFGSATPAPAAGGLFGSSAPAPSTGGFGFGAAANAAKPASGGLFGSASTPAPSSGLFGAAPASTSTGLFGAAPAPATTGGLFGSTSAPATGGLFGSTPAPTPAATGGLFGSTTPAPAPASGGLFGSTATSPAPVFGATPAPATGGLFGTAPAPATGGLFGSSTPAPATGGLFGSTAPAPATGGLFGTTPAPATGGLFGASSAPKPATTGLFGAPAAPTPASGGLFGTPAAPAPLTSGLFGAPAPSTFAPAPSPFAATNAPAPTTSIVAPPTADALLAQQLAAVEKQKNELALLEAWRGSSSSSSSNVLPTSLSEKNNQERGSSSSLHPKASSSSAYSSALMSYQAIPRSVAKIRPRGFGRPMNYSTSGATSLGIGNGGNGRGNSSPLLSPNAYLKSSVKHLVIKPPSESPKPKMRLLLTNGGNSPHKEQLATSTTTPSPSLNNRGNQRFEDSNGGDGANDNGGILTPESNKKTPENFKTRIQEFSPESPAPNPTSDKKVSSSSTRNSSTANASSTSVTPLHNGNSKSPSLNGNGDAYDFYRQVIGSPESPSSKEGNDQGTPIGAIFPYSQGITNNNKTSKSFLPKMTKEGYITSPSLETLCLMTEADLAAVSNFVVERDGHGSVAWEGAVDIRGVDLDTTVSIEETAVAVYEIEESEGRKPPVGSKLNRPAVITMHNIFKGGTSATTEEGREKLERKIAKKTKKMGADFISFDLNSGVWKFRVSHFSRYGLGQDSDDEEEVELLDNRNMNQKSNFELGGRAGRSLVRSGQQIKDSSKKSRGFVRLQAPTISDDDMSEKTEEMEEESIGLSSEASKIGHEDKILEAADNAYAMIFGGDKTMIQGTEEHSDMVDTEEENSDDVMRYMEEGEDSSEYILPVIDIDTCRSTASTSKPFSICGEISKRCGIKSETASCTDYSLRMGRSFRVCWKPDGSLVHPGRFSNRDTGAKILKETRPVFSKDGRQSPTASTDDELQLSPLLSIHLKHSSRNKMNGSDVPIFILPNRTDVSTNECSVQLLRALENYKKTADDKSKRPCDKKHLDILSHAVSLLLTMYWESTSIDIELSPESSWRKIQCLKTWFTEINADDVKQDILNAESQNDIYAAILAALSGNDRTKAESICIENGLFRLSLALTNSSLQAGYDLSDQKELWDKNGASSHFPSNLLRIYSFLKRDLELEKSIYSNSGLNSRQILDWRRRLGMLLLCNEDLILSKGQCPITWCISQYESDFKKGLAPFPSARHLVQESTFSYNVVSEKCVLYRILEVLAKNNNTSLASVISPGGHTSSSHDSSISFHLAAVLSALGLCVPLSESEEFHLLESYAVQLINDGSWEWAVYVFLCSFGSACNNLFGMKMKIKKAMDVVLRNYTNDCTADKFSKQRRSFLENIVGIPSAWFEMALSFRCIQSFDPWQYVKHTAQFSSDDAVKIYKDVILSTLLFAGGQENCQNILNFLDACDASNTCSQVHSFLKLAHDVHHVTHSSKVDTGEVKHLLQKVLELENNLSSDDGRKVETVPYFDRLVKVPNSISLVELSVATSLFAMQLRALLAGHSIFDDKAFCTESDFKRLKMMSQLAFLSANQPDDSFSFSNLHSVLGSENTLRGRYGIS